MRRTLARLVALIAAPFRWLRRRWSWRRTWWTIGVGLTLLVLGPTLFIATQCYGNGEGAPASAPPGINDLPAARRAEAFTYLTLPEWFIVYSADEYAKFVERDRPSRFPYFRSIAQYWRYYSDVCEVTSREYGFEGGYHLMLGVIGASFTVEYLIKGLYEKTVGRVTEWISEPDTPEDAFGVRTAREYGTFMHTVPWYQFPFFAKLGALWRETPFFGRRLLRKWERRAALSAEYTVKGTYGFVMGLGVGAAYAPEDLQIHVWVEHPAQHSFGDARIHIVKPIDRTTSIIRLPRYEAFTDVMRVVLQQPVKILSIAGNDEVFLTAIVPAPVVVPIPGTTLITSVPILTESPKVRVGLRMRVTALQDVVAELGRRGIVLEHIYDY